MTAHELAKVLFDGPDYFVICEDGMDPSDKVEVTRVEVAPFKFFDSESKFHETQAVSIG